MEVIVQVSNGEKITVKEEVWKDFNTIKQMIDDIGVSEIVIDKITSETLNEIIKLVTNYNSIKQGNSIDLDKEEEIKKLMNDLFNEQTIGKVYELLKGLDFLGFDTNSDFIKDLYGFYVDYLINGLSCLELEEKILKSLENPPMEKQEALLQAEESGSVKNSGRCQSCLTRPPSVEDERTTRFVSVDEENNIIRNNLWIMDFLKKYCSYSETLTDELYSREDELTIPAKERREICKDLIYQKFIVEQI